MHSEFKHCEPKLFSVLEVLAWIKQSGEGVHPCPLTLPPMQRNGVWRPRQVLDLWRSALDGMPIGLFYLQPAGEKVVNQADQKYLTDAPTGALDLFDGQQRIRALALGAGDPFNDERSIWVKFVENGYELIMSSKLQPAGYKADGSKLRVEDRRNYLAAIKTAKEAGKTKAPFPLGCTCQNTRRLVDLLDSALLNDGVVADSLRPANTVEEAWGKLKAAFEKLKRGSAIFMLLPELEDRGKTLELFRRVGAGGTPLSEPEQVYSAYKLYRPDVRIIVETIHKDVSAVLSPAQIVQAAMRMAHTKSDERMVWPPGFETAMKELSLEQSKAGWVSELNTLLCAKAGLGSLIDAFRLIRRLLEGSKTDDFYLPEIVIARLPPELWQVLAFWALPGNRNTDAATQEEIIRFAMAWHLAVFNQERATQECFKGLVAFQGNGFPGQALFNQLSNVYAHPIPHPDELNCMFHRGGNDRWLPAKDRFKSVERHSDLASTWWFSRKILPWLQRDYVSRRFSDYHPMSDHEDDVPYDWDHICPKAHWQPEGRGSSAAELAKKMNFRDQHDRKARMSEPWMIGNSVGNLRLVDFSQNRSDGDRGIFEKMTLLKTPNQSNDLGSAGDFLLEDPKELALWLQVDTGNCVWDASRLDAFQKVVELRTARLYRLFYDGLKFDCWNRGRPILSNPT